MLVPDNSPVPYSVTLSRWAREGDMLTLFIVSRSNLGNRNYVSRQPAYPPKTYRFRAYAPGLNSPLDLELGVTLRQEQPFDLPGGLMRQGVLRMLDVPDHPRTDPSLVTWGTGGNQAVLLKLEVQDLAGSWTFPVNLPVLTTFDRLDGNFYTY